MKSSSSGPTPSSPEALLKLLEEGDGVVHVIDPPREVRAAWRRLLHVVRRDGHVPDGWHLRQRGRDDGDLVVELRPGEHPVRRYRASPAGAIAVPDGLADPHPVVDALRNQPRRLPASQRNRTRALMILEALAREAQRRGYEIQPGTASTLLTVVASEIAYGVEIFEGSGTRWTLRLAIRIDGPGKGTDAWADYANRPVEHQLEAVLDQIGARGTRVAAERQERERRERERVQQEYEAAVTRRWAQLLRREVNAWRLAADIRQHCNEMIAAGLDSQDPWLRWARRYADDLDPTIDPRGMPDPPSEQELARERIEQQQSRLSRSSTSKTAEPAGRPWHPNRRWWSQ